jgi:RNA polymerase sigma factor
MSIGLIAFNEAIDSYEEGKGDFYGLAYRVMERRLADSRRKEKRYEKEIPVEPYVLDGTMDEDPSPLQKEVAKEAADTEVPQHEGAEEEIEAVQNILKEYGFSFFDIAGASPKAAKTKQQCAWAVCILLEHRDLFADMRRTHSLPAKEMIEAAKTERQVKLKSGVLDRCRRYIIAAAEILAGEYPVLSSYLNGIRKELHS